MAGQARKRGKRANGEGSIYQRGDTGKWVAQIPIGHYRNGSVKYKRQAFATQREALAHLRAMQDEVDAGVDLGTKSQTLAAYLDHWLTTVVKPNREPKTYEGYAYTVGLITPTLGRVTLNKLTPAHIEQLLNELRERGGEHGQGLSPRTVQYVRATLRRALGRAFKQGLVPRNVVAQTDPPPGERPEVQPFSETQAHRLLDAVAGDRLEALYNVAVMLGLRQGELLGLRWADVDFGNGLLRVRRQLQDVKGVGLMLKALKTRGSRRDLDLGDDLLRQFRAHQDRQRLERQRKGDAWQDRGLVFPSAVGTPMSPRNLTRHYKRLLGRAGLPDRRFHDLRHTAASIMFDQGVEAAEVSRVLGHSSIAITIDTYIHLMPKTRKRTAAVMDAWRAASRARVS
ncbi:MAG TPA: tyrosine-type recombinase/integrase [Thermomicrobiales bacterium]|nr:tyrosine-type recombinase/integrase [Thermomicrobiales bacterium]